MDNNTNFTIHPVNKKPGVRISGAGVIAIVIIVALVIGALAFRPFVTIPSGHTGILVTFGRVSENTLDSGFHLKSPIQQVVVMDHRTQKARITLEAFSSDIQQVDVVCSVNYSIDRQMASVLYKTVGTQYYDTVMEPRILECVKAVFTRYTAEKLMQVRDTLSVQVKELLAPEMSPYGISVLSVAIENVDFTDAFTNAVEEKQVAEQTKLRVETEQSQQVSVEKATAERQIISANAVAQEKTILAEADASVAKIRADAAAYARGVEAEAEAEANAKLAASITKDLIDYMKANQWDGKLPTYMGGGEATPILDMRTAD